MNPQIDISGQISRKVPGQNTTSMSGLPLQNVIPESAQMQNPIMHGTALVTEAERKYMQRKIFEVLMHQHQQSRHAPPQKIGAIVKRLELGLLESCRSKEEYLSMATLRSRLTVLIKRCSSQRLQHGNFSPSICTMIPTPGLQQPGNSVVNGALAGEHQQSFFSLNAMGDNRIPSAGVQRQTSQMIPTPGFNSNGVNNNSNSQSTNMAHTNIRTTFPAVKSSSVSQVAQNGRVLHDMSRGVKSMSQHNSNGPTNWPLNERFEHLQPVIQGDICGTATSNVPTSGSLPPVSSTGLVTTYQCFSAITIQESNPVMSRHESNVESARMTKPHSITQSNKINFQSQSTVRENLLQPHQSRGKTLVRHHIENQAWLNADNTSDKSQLSPRPISFSEAKSRPEEYLQQIDVNLQNSTGTHRDAALRGFQGDSKSDDTSHGSRRLPLDHDVQDILHQRLNGQDVAQLNDNSPEGSTRITAPLNMNEKVRQPSIINREKLLSKQRNWLLSLGHARKCPSQEGKCQEPNCVMFQKLCKHMKQCQEFHCPHPQCHYTKTLISHYKSCCDANCPVCVPVKNRMQAQRLMAFTEFPSLINGSEVAGISTNTANEFNEIRDDFNPVFKRMKIEQVECSGVELYQESSLTNNSEIEKLKIEASDNLGASDNIFEMKTDSLQKTKLESEQVDFPNVFSHAVQEVHEQSVLLPLETVAALKTEKPKITGVSMTEFFTTEQIQQHIKGLRQCVGQCRSLVDRNQATDPSISENSCQLCLVEKLSFEPPPLYCTPCGARVKRNAMYYTIGTFETRHYFCIPCYNETLGGTVIVDGISISKARMEKKKNDEESGESWVQCDKCEAWQHQICALFNGKRNDCGQAEYICPKCFIKEVEKGERLPLPWSDVLGAKDLPKTFLSDHLEQRLFAKLDQDRCDRAKIQGKSYDEVPGAESLIVRVVSSVDKKLEVKPQFLQLFKNKNYPSEFPYKSKVVLLFQTIDGVEVCLFGMYLQEYGSECQQPNNRRVYLSYLDSVKYFRPEVKAVTGEALRTFVYHEILIGYLDYCKQRGFTSCYIWACPPLKGEDYILYCHPEVQKTPKADKLREWYLSMLGKATKENIVVGVTNLYEQFFVSNDECKEKMTASRLPYFDGDYWPGAAEDIISLLQQEENGKKQYKGAMKMTITKQALKSSGHIHFSGKASKDLILMHQLGEIISPMKEDFIMVHLRHACKHCCIPMVSGKSWVCKECINFHLCDKCHEAEQKCEDWERHPIHQKGKHDLYLVEVNGVPLDTKDTDEILESEFFDTRQAFLSLCQGNHYQYDTLRRAKHSSMIILYHLHNPSAPAFVATCNMCHVDIENGQGFRCSTCPDYDVCNSCYQKDGGMGHPHEMTNCSANDCSAQNAEARALRVMQLKNMLQLLVHASQCRLAHCHTQDCCKVKTLFRHGIICRIRANGGCELCRKMWSLLHFHARSCKESNCTVPRCRELKEYLKRLKCQSETRRRAAVNEMMRQRRLV